ncbi:MAG: hypothetical protein ACRC6V_00570 [Bacteroidales bacterium]
MGSKKQTTTTESNPWGPAQDVLKKILGDASSLYDKQGGLNGEWLDKELADLNPEMQAAVKDMLGSDQMKQTLGQINQSAQQGLGGIGQASGVLGGMTQQGITSGDINKMAGELYDKESVDSKKGQLGKELQEGLAKTTQGINQAAGGSGSMGSSRAGVAEGVAVGETADAYASGASSIENAARQQAMGGALSTLAGNQSTALGAAGQLGSLGLGSGNLMQGGLNGQNQILQNQLQGAGILQGQQQNQLNNKWFNQQGQQQAGWKNLSNLMGFAGSIGGMGGTTTGTTSGGGPGALQQAVGMGTGIMGGLGAMGGSAGIAGLAGMFSDASLKKKVKRTGKKTKTGEAEYEWEWNDKAKKTVGKSGKNSGVLAQQAAKNNPDAVVRDKKSGKLMVDYNRV